jgi:hypothetical protein
MSDRKTLDVSKASECQKKLILQYAADVRKFEIERFWQRSLFFWGFIAAAFLAYSGSYNKNEELLPFLIAGFGVVCSLAWTLQNRGSKYWQEAWEVESVEENVLGASLFSNKEPIKSRGLWNAGAFSVSRLAIGLSDFTVIIWCVLLVVAFPRAAIPTWLTQEWTILVPVSIVSLITWIVLAITAIYVIFLFRAGRSKI